MVSKNQKRKKESQAGTIRRQIRLPFLKALIISVKSLKIRMGRSLITMGGIFFGIAFLMSVFTSTSINSALARFGSLEIKMKVGSSTDIEASKYWLVTLSLLVCAVGITNSMLMAVTERYKEIGTMKCLGALDRFILELFLLESSFQGLLSSVAGTIAGFLAMFLLSQIRYGAEVTATFPTIVILKYGLISIAVGLGLSVIGALYPAYRASKMVPADAMRTEI